MGVRVASHETVKERAYRVEAEGAGVVRSKHESIAHIGSRQPKGVQ